MTMLALENPRLQLPGDLTQKLSGFLSQIGSDLSRVAASSSLTAAQHQEISA